MRNIRIAAPADRISAAPPPAPRRWRLVDWIATVPIVALLPALLLLASVASGSEASLASTPSTTTRSMSSRIAPCLSTPGWRNHRNDTHGLASFLWCESHWTRSDAISDLGTHATNDVGRY